MWKDQVFVKYGAEIEDYDYAIKKYRLAEDVGVQESLNQIVGNAEDDQMIGQAQYQMNSS